MPATTPALAPPSPPLAPAPALLRLMAMLLAPAPGASILDPHCGKGETLLAVHQAHPQAPEQALRLFGQEPDATNLATARERLQAAGIPDAALLATDVLRQPTIDTLTCQLLRVDHVISWVPANQGPWSQSWAERDRFRRFPAGPPEPRELARIWHNLACLKPHGNMVLLLPASTLTSMESYPLRQYLLRNWLDVVITVPAALWPEANQPLLILICQRNTQRERIAFIHPNRDSPAMDADTILAAYWAHQHVYAHSCLKHLPHTMFKRGGFSLNVADYPPAAMAAQALAHASTAPA